MKGSVALDGGRSPAQFTIPGTRGNRRCTGTGDSAPLLRLLINARFERFERPLKLLDQGFE
jgi:hypothetical protein